MREGVGEMRGNCEGNFRDLRKRKVLYSVLLFAVID